MTLLFRLIILGFYSTGLALPNPGASSPITIQVTHQHPAAEHEQGSGHHHHESSDETDEVAAADHDNHSTAAGEVNVPSDHDADAPHSHTITIGTTFSYCTHSSPINILPNLSLNEVEHFPFERQPPEEAHLGSIFRPPIA